MEKTANNNILYFLWYPEKCVLFWFENVNVNSLALNRNLGWNSFLFGLFSGLTLSLSLFSLYNLSAHVCVACFGKRAWVQLNRKGKSESENINLEIKLVHCSKKRCENYSLCGIKGRKGAKNIITSGSRVKLLRNESRPDIIFDVPQIRRKSCERDRPESS